MSRRKQGRPQQRKTQDSLEQENDLLVCGDCQTSFPLHDIVQFIRHKKQCCNKENVDNSDSASRKPDSSNSNDTSADNNDDRDHDGMEQEGVDMSKESFPREEGDETTGENDSDNEEDFEAVRAHGRLADGDKKEVLKKEGKSARKEEKISSTSSSSRELRTPLRPRQVVDAESNTTHSEPSRFVCETCRSTYTSAWALLQHAQKEHGMKIYTSPNSASSQYQHTSACTPITSSMSPIDLMVASSPRSGVDHRSASAGSAGSVSPYPLHAPNPFSSPFRLPLDSRLTHPTSLSPFSRPSNFDFDLINDYRLRPQLIARGAPGLDHPSFCSSPFDRARTHISPVLDSQYDFYSMRLKQLASSPVVAQSKSQFATSNHHQPPNFAATPTSSHSESPPVEASLTSSPGRSSLTSALVLPPKQKACEFCGKTFRFQSNLVVHRRSHTGEKPYKCHQCPHACTQQSKLKRHMKTHSNKSEGEMSPNGLSIHKVDGEYDDADDDEEEEDDEDEEFEEEEEFIEEEMNEEEREVLRKMRDMQDKEEQTREPGEICHEAKKIKLEGGGESKVEEHNAPSDLSIKSKPTESLLSEVMKKTGLNDIQTYSEAYKAALAESQENGTSKGEVRSSVSVDSTSSNRVHTPDTANPKILKVGVKRELDSEKESDKDYHRQHPLIGGTDLNKSIKKETTISSAWPSSVEALPTSNIDPTAAAIYSRLHPSWFHADNPVRLYFPGYASHFSNVRDLSLNPENHNGLNLSNSLTPTSSALKVDSQSIPALLKPRLTSPPAYTSNFLGSSSTSSSPTGSLVLPSNGSAITPPRKESRRNDTCEYCGKVFKNCSNLTVHRRSHTGEKPYKCNLCSYACAQSSKLTRHMKTHGRQGKDVYTCKFCNMPFSVPSTLEKHMRKCVENRNARLLATDDGDISSESNGELSRQSDSASGVYE